MAPGGIPGRNYVPSSLCLSRTFLNSQIYRQTSAAPGSVGAAAVGEGASGVQDEASDVLDNRTAGSARAMPILTTPPHSAAEQGTPLFLLPAGRLSIRLRGRSESYPRLAGIRGHVPCDRTERHAMKKHNVTLTSPDHLLKQCMRNEDFARKRFEASKSEVDRYLLLCAEKRTQDYRDQIRRRREQGRS